MQQRPTGKVQWVHQNRAEELSPGWPFAACLLRLCGVRDVAAGSWAREERTASLILRVAGAGGIVFIFGEMEVSWISTCSFHLAAGMVLTPLSPCPDLEGEAHQGSW